MLVEFLPLYASILSTADNMRDFQQEIALKFVNELNPTLDPVVYDLQTAQLAWLRMVYMTGPEVRRMYWRFLGEDSELMAQAMHDYSRDMLAAIQVSTREHIRQSSIAELASINIDEFGEDEDFSALIHKNLAMLAHIKTMSQEAEKAGDTTANMEWFMSQMGHFNVPASMLPLTPMVHNMNDAYNRTDKITPGMPFFTGELPEATRIPMREYMFSTSLIESAMHNSSRALLVQLHKGLIRGEKKSLLVNEEIPLPNEGTFLGWWNLCGLFNYRMNTAELESVKHLGNYTHTAGFILPCMPMTFDHRNGGGVQDAASDARESLSSKSTSHARKESGAIDHGDWSAWGILFDPENPDDVHIFARVALQNLRVSSQAVVAQMGSLLPEEFSSYGTRKLFLSDGNPKTWAASPFFTQERNELVVGMPVNWMSRTIDGNLRDLAESYNTVFRFDSNHESSVTWVTEFIRRICHAWTVGPIALNGEVFRYLTIRSYAELDELASTRVRGKGKTSAKFKF